MGRLRLPLLNVQCTACRCKRSTLNVAAIKHVRRQAGRRIHAPGEELHASTLLLPAAATTKTPAACAFATALFNAELKPPPSDIDIILFCCGALATWLMPLMTVVVVPLPVLSSTRTAYIFTSLATPAAAHTRRSVLHTSMSACCPWEH